MFALPSPLPAAATTAPTATFLAQVKHALVASPARQAELLPAHLEQVRKALVPPCEPLCIVHACGILRVLSKSPERAQAIVPCVPALLALVLDGRSDASLLRTCVKTLYALASPLHGGLPGSGNGGNGGADAVVALITHPHPDVAQLGARCVACGARPPLASVRTCVEALLRSRRVDPDKYVALSLLGALDVDLREELEQKTMAVLLSADVADDVLDSAGWMAAGSTPLSENACLAAVKRLRACTEVPTPLRAAAVKALAARLPASSLVMCTLLAPCAELVKLVPASAIKPLLLVNAGEALLPSRVCLAALLVEGDAHKCSMALACLHSRAFADPAMLFLLTQLSQYMAGSSWPHVLGLGAVDRLAEAAMAGEKDAVLVLARMCALWEGAREAVAGHAGLMSAMTAPRALRDVEWALLANVACTRSLALKRALVAHLEPLKHFVCEAGLPLLRNLAAGGPDHVALVLPALREGALASLADSAVLFELVGNVCASHLGQPWMAALKQRAASRLLDDDVAIRLAAMRVEYNVALITTPADSEPVRLLADHDASDLVRAMARRVVALSAADD